MRLRRPPVAILSALVAATSLTAQNVATFPSAAAGAEGGTYERRFPFGNGVSRVMAIYDNWDLTIPNGSSITAVGFRQELGRASAARAVQLEVYMGPAAHPAASATGTFANNFPAASPPVQVFGPSIVNLPALDAAATTATEVFVTLATPHIYDASQPLLVEFRILANNNANGTFDYYLDESTYYSAVSQFGQGCTSSAGQVPALTFNPSYIGGNFTATLRNAPASSFIYLNLDVAPTPAVPGGPFGAPGCTLYVPPVLIETRQAGSTSGSATFTLPVPLDPSYYNFDVYGQCLIADLFANNLGFVSSNAAQITIGARASMASITGTGNATAPTGSRRVYDGAVTLFRWQ